MKFTGRKHRSCRGAGVALAILLVQCIDLSAGELNTGIDREPAQTRKGAFVRRTNAGQSLTLNTSFAAFQIKNAGHKPPDFVHGAKRRGLDAKTGITLFEIPKGQDPEQWKAGGGHAASLAAGLEPLPCYVEPGCKWVVPTAQVLVKFRRGVGRDKATEFLIAGGALSVSYHRVLQNLAVARIASPAGSFDLADQWAASPLVEWAEADCFREVRTKWIPDDEFFKDQWYLRNTGQSGGFRNHDIEIEKAWDITRGTSTVVVAVLDNGFDMEHLDLKANVYSNAVEGFAGQDNDGNGYINDVHGWDFVGGDNDPSPDPADRHGTAVAGLITAVANNFCIAGVAPECRFLPVRTYTDSLGAALVNWMDAITYAADKADVLSISAYIYPSQAAHEAIRYAVSQGRGGLGCVVCTALGNSGVRRRYDGDLASAAEVLSVSALSNYDKRSFFGDYGPAVNVMCPGGGGSLDLYTTDWSGTNGYNDSYYHYGFNGTSASCPMAAGVAALILSAHPTWPGIRVRRVLEDTCDPVDATSHGYDARGRNEQYGRGRVNAWSALQYTNSVWDNFEPDDGTNSASQISDGEMQYRALDPAGEQDWAYMVLSNNADICLSIVGSTNLVLSLYNSGSNLVSPDSSSYPPYATAVYSNCAAGKYFAKVANAGAMVVSNYGLHLAVLGTPDEYEPDNALGTAKAIGPRQMQYRSMYPAGDVDWATFTLSSSSRVDISTFGEWNGDTKMWLRNSSGDELAYNDDPVESNNYYSVISTNLDAGDYYIEIRQYDNLALSTYQLLLETDAADEWEAMGDNITNGATVITSGSISAHTLHVTNDVDWFRFSVDKPSTALLVTDSLNPDFTKTLSETKISLFNAAMTPLAEDQGGNRFVFSALVATNLDAGTCYLKVEGYLLTNACPDYTVSLDLFEKQTAVEAVSADAGGVTFQWQGEASFMYLIQYASNLVASNAWMTATSVEGRIGSNTWTDDGNYTTPGPGVASNRFYRVVTE